MSSNPGAEIRRDSRRAGIVTSSGPTTRWQWKKGLTQKAYISSTGSSHCLSPRHRQKRKHKGRKEEEASSNQEQTYKPLSRFELAQGGQGGMEQQNAKNLKWTAAQGQGGRRNPPNQVTRCHVNAQGCRCQGARKEGDRKEKPKS